MTRSRKHDAASVDRLLDDLHAVVTDAEALLKATASQAGEKVQEARARTEDSLSAARERLAQVKEDALHKVRDVIDGGEEFVRQNPWQAVGIAAGAGMLVGLLINLGRR